MLSPNLAFNLFSKQPYSVYGQGLNPNSVQSSDLSAFIHVLIMKFYIIFVCFTRFDLDRPYYFMELPDPDPTCIFPTRHNTNLNNSQDKHNWI